MRGGNNRGVYKLGKFDMVGRTFGRLIVLRRDEILTSHTSRSARWWCKCDCGEERSVLGRNLRSGVSTSCGCRHQDIMAQRLKHGYARRNGKSTPEYAAYYSAQQRCTNPKNQGYGYYGKRGIKFLYTSFQQFLADVGPRPSPKHSLDRYPDNDGNYEPGNCRWATQSEQNKNKHSPGFFHPQCDGSMTSPIDEIMLAHIRRKGKVMEKL